MKKSTAVNRRQPPSRPELQITLRVRRPAKMSDFRYPGTRYIIKIPGTDTYICCSGQRNPDGFGYLFIPKDQWIPEFVEIDLPEDCWVV